MGGLLVVYCADHLRIKFDARGEVCVIGVGVVKISGRFIALV